MKYKLTDIKLNINAFIDYQFHLNKNCNDNHNNFNDIDVKS